jgi:transcriptional regulator with XRE-family HTH domain
MSPQELSLLIEGRAAVTSGRGTRIRETAGLSQSELARLVGVTPAAISRWEAGERTPSGESAVSYAKALRRLAQEVALHG